jgi:hypothetical protein
MSISVLVTQNQHMKYFLSKGHFTATGHITHVAQMCWPKVHRSKGQFASALAG